MPVFKKQQDFCKILFVFCLKYEEVSIFVFVPQSSEQLPKARRRSSNFPVCSTIIV